MQEIHVFQKVSSPLVPVACETTPPDCHFLHRWLESNSLEARHLTPMDALGPTAVPHTAKHVPVLNKHVTAKVFDGILPLAHVSHDHQVTLINPKGVDLSAYQHQLQQQSQTYWHRLTRLAWTAIPEERRGEVGRKCGVPEGEPPPYKQHRAVLRDVMAELGWLHPQKDFDLLEAELAVTESYQQQVQALQEEDQAVGVASLGSTHSSESSLTVLMDQLQRHTSPVDVGRRGRGPQRRPRGKVIARSIIDGFYYPGEMLVADPNPNGTERLYMCLQLC